MADLRQLCEALGIDQMTAVEVIRKDRAESDSALSMPWYARIIVGFGAWVTAIVAIVLGGVILAFLEIEAEYSLAVMGAAFLGSALLWLRSFERQAYVTQLGIAVAAAGTAMITAGVGMETKEVWAATAVSAVLTMVIIFATHHRSLQFLAALLTAFLFITTLVAEEVPYYLDIAALVGPVAVFLMLQPSRRNVQPAATVLLISMPLFGIFYDINVRMWGVGTPGGWFARILYVAVFLWLAYIHWQRVTDEAARYRLSIFAAAAVAVGLLLPPGGSASLVIVMLAFTLGSRPLALLGVLLQILYIWRFYYDMQATLLTKSGVMFAVGVVFIVAWWFMQRSAPAEEPA